MFLKRIFHKLLMNFTWWLNRQDKEGNDLFGGGFLGLDNIGAFDRSHLPAGTELEQSDAIGLDVPVLPLDAPDRDRPVGRDDPAYEDLVTSFLEHAVRITAAMNRSGLWDETDGFYYDALKLADGSTVPIKVHSMVGLIPLLPSAEVPAWSVDRGARLGKRFASFLDAMRVTDDRPARGWFRQRRSRARDLHGQRRPAGAASPSCWRRCFSEDAFLAPTGLRALSKRHATEPFKLELGGLTAEVDYEPGESTSGLFGGNSNWRGPIWFPLNYLTIQALRNWDTWLGEDNSIEFPTGSGNQLRLRDVSADLANRLISTWLPDAAGRRPVYGAIEKFQTDPEWNDLLQFHEYFHGDTGAGIGASHQTGWTGLVAHLICRGGVVDQIAQGRALVGALGAKGVDGR